MKWIFCLLFFLEFEPSFSQCSKEVVDKLRKIAFVVGETSYTNLDPLNNPMNDALDMYDVLTRLKFKVDLDTNVEYKKLYLDIERWTEKIDDCDIALFYFSGHGGEMDGINYIYPLNADVGSVSALKGTTYSVEKLVKRMEAANPNVNIIILDACRDNPIVRSFKHSHVKNGFVSMEPSSLNPNSHGTLICFPAAQGKTTDEGHGRNGTYTEAILKYIERPNTSLTNIFQMVKDEVLEVTNSRQNPCYYTSLGNKNNYCIKYDDYNSKMSPDVYRSDTILSRNVIDLKSDIQATENRRLYLAKEVFQTTSALLNKVVAQIKDSLGKDFGSIQSGYGTNYDSLTWGDRVGITNGFFEYKRVWPTTTVAIKGSYAYFKLDSKDEARLVNFENENHLDHQITLREPLMNIDWSEVQLLIRNYYALRLKALE